MSRLAEQHQPSSYKDITDPYTPSQEWPDDCLVQWGSHGIVLGNPGYNTAFFEAFPKDPKTFIRGEGKDLKEAEDKALAHFRRVRQCPGHEFEKRGYINGAGFCKHCSLFKSKVFEPWEPCHGCGVLTYYNWQKIDGELKFFCKDCFAKTPEGIEHQASIDGLNQLFGGRR